MENQLTQDISNNLFAINNLWMMLATALVFIMHLGFAALEAGLTQSKNTINILFKNSVIPAIGLLTYTIVGFNLMYPGKSFAGTFFGFAGLLEGDAPPVIAAVTMSFSISAGLLGKYIWNSK